MNTVCTSQPLLTTESILGILGALGLIVAAVGALGVKVLQNAKDIRAAWDELRLHGTVLNGAVEATRKAQRP